MKRQTKRRVTQATPNDSLKACVKQVERFCKKRDWDQFHDIKELAIGCVTESAELLDLFRFLSQSECEALLKDPRKAEEVRDELADVFYFVLRISGKYRIDLAQALAEKLAKNEAKYPVEKSRGSNRKYHELG